MKKLIVFLAALALVSGAVFAQPVLSGEMTIGMNVIEANHIDDGEGKIDSTDINMGGIGFHESLVRFDFGDEQGGGRIVMQASTPTNDAYEIAGFDGSWKAHNFGAWGYLYWQPVSVFRMQMGINADGDFQVARISGYDFTGVAKNSVAAFNTVLDKLSDFDSHAFYPGTEDLLNLNLSLMPIEGLSINFVLPVNGVDVEISNQMSDFHLNINYAITDVGIASLSFVGLGGLQDKDKNNLSDADFDALSVGNIYASFFLSAIDNMELELGLSFNLAAKDKSGGQIGVGAGFTYDLDALQFKLRGGAFLGGKEADGETDRDTMIAFDILPSYAISDTLRLYLLAGLFMNMPNEGDNEMGWHVNPYLQVRIGENMNFWAGIQLYTETDQGTDIDKAVQVRIPVGFNFSF